MVNIRIAGILVALIILIYVTQKYRRGAYRKFDLLIGLIISIGIALLSAFPGTANILTQAFGLENRLFATLVFANIVLFALFLYVLNKSNRANRMVGELVRAIAREDFKSKYKVDATDKLIAIVIPAFNEEEAIAGVLSKVPDSLLEFKVRPIVVVDGAGDKTAEVVKREKYLMATHVLNRGQGDSLRTGFEIALNQGADIVVTMDADGQHRPEELPNFIEPIISGNADYVMGSRFLGEYEDAGSIRHVGILFFNLMINVLTRLRITDCTNGYRAILGEKLRLLHLQEDRFSAPELIMEAHRNGLRIIEIPTTIKQRDASVSKKPGGLRYPLGFLRTIVQTWLR